MEMAGPAITHRTAQHRGPGHMHLARFRHDGLVQRMPLVAVALSDKNPKQTGVLRDLHFQTPLTDSTPGRPYSRAIPRSGTAIRKPRRWPAPKPIRRPLSG